MRCILLLYSFEPCPVDFLISAAVAEFKGPDIFGVVRLAQVNMELTRIEANFSGLSPGKHAWSINEFGDLTRGAASTGKLYSLVSNTQKNILFMLNMLYYLLSTNLCFLGAWILQYTCIEKERIRIHNINYAIMFHLISLKDA